MFWPGTEIVEPGMASSPGTDLSAWMGQRIASSGIGFGLRLPSPFTLPRQSLQVYVLVVSVVILTRMVGGLCKVV